LAGWIIAAQISGAHFNPAISVAVYLVEAKFKPNRFYLIAECISQIIGSFSGILFSHLIIKSDFSGLYATNFLYPRIDNLRYYDNGFLLQGPSYFKVIFIEVLYTLLLCLVFLILKYNNEFKKYDYLLRGLAFFLVS
jgi:glycerol uptake facilitator-like aquaporin